jgi:hypothetical protein
MNSAPVAPVRSPLQLDSMGRITSPAWLAFFQQGVQPGIQIAIDVQGSGMAEWPVPATHESSEMQASSILFGPNRPQPDPALISFPSLRPVADVLPYVFQISPNREPQQTLPVVHQVQVPQAWAIYDTHANRANYPNGFYPAGALFYETDRAILFRNTGTAWTYLAGTYYDTLSNIPSLGSNDAGYLFCATDYNHVVRWNGSAWAWAQGEVGSGMFVDFAVVPSGNGWHVCDGSTVTYMKSDGTTATVTLPNISSTASYGKHASTYSATITAATVPTISGNTDASTANFPSGTGNDSGGGTVVQSGTGSTVASHTHNHTVSDFGHQHNVSSGNAPIALPGDPIAHYQTMRYFRL